MKMGIRLLQTYITHCVRNGVLTVNMEDEVRKYKYEWWRICVNLLMRIFHREHNKDQPLIVIDLRSICRMFFPGKHESLLGGRSNVYNNGFDILMERLNSMGARMVFFSEAQTRVEKIPELLERLNHEYSITTNAFGLIDSGADLSTQSEDMNVLPPALDAIYDNFKILAKKYGDVHSSVLNDSDVELADYATKNNALAILTNDTDFLIFEGDWKCWSTKHIDVATLTTKEFNRRALWENLGLRGSQLALFATLCGNNIVRYEFLQEYHNRIIAIGREQMQGRGYRRHSSNIKLSHFQTVARQVQLFRCQEYVMPEPQIMEISKSVFDVGGMVPGPDLIKSSLKFYDYAQLDREFDSEFLSRISRSKRKMNYILLSNLKYVQSVHYFDLSKSDLMPFFDIISPLIRRIMGILLKNETRPVLRTFYCKLSHTRDYEATTLEAEFPPYEVPALEELLFKKSGLSEILDNARLDLLCWQISNKLSPKLVQNLPANNVANLLTLFYLVELKQIDVDEADCLLLACNCSEETRDALQLNDMKHINERDARISFLFMDVLSHIKNCLCAVGLSHLWDLVCFDGLYFHSLRQNLNSIDKEKHLKDNENLRIYASSV